MSTSNYHFPFQPYDIQLKFMQTLYAALEEKKVAILESPTECKGKSLSLIAGSLTWLREYKRRLIEQEVDSDTESGEPRWVVEAAKEAKRRRIAASLEARKERLQNARDRETEALERYQNNGESAKRRKLDVSRDSDFTESDDSFLIKEYDSDITSGSKKQDCLGASSETQRLLDKLGFGSSVSPKAQDDAEEGPIILYCSRTHSQIAQFVSELRKVKLPASFCTTGSENEEELTRHVSLGSRKNLCLNPNVSRLGSTEAMNEACHDLQSSKAAAKGKCQYMPSQDDEAVLQKFRDYAVSRIRDIEDLGKLGKKMSLCPYYASRSAAKAAEIITMPYQLLLHKSARESLGISLKDNVVIIDEAHNLLDTIASINSCQMTLQQLSKCRQQLMAYLAKFNKRLAGKNRSYLAQLVRVVDSLIAFLGSKKLSEGKEGVAPVNRLLAGKAVDQINLHKLHTYIKDSRLARKIDGYAAYVVATTSAKPDGEAVNVKEVMMHDSGSTPVTMILQSLLLALANPSTEGRFFYEKLGDQVTLRYKLLDTTESFREVVEEARSVILAGGTMSPIEEWTDHLLPYLSPSRLYTLSCSHIVASSNMAIYTAEVSANEVEFDFKFSNRHKCSLKTAAGLTLLECASEIPDGVIAFFPSYTYMEECIGTWKQSKMSSKKASSDGSCSIWDSLQLQKPVFFESKKPDVSSRGQVVGTERGAAEQSSVLELFSRSVKAGQGGILLAVISGSLSEGINFSDELGRGIMVFGLPYPNPHCAEWRAKLEYISQKSAERAGYAATQDKDGSGTAAAREHFDNITMRAVNQAIGRAIRHKNDYAAIVLVDQRYSQARIRKKLPGWMTDSFMPEHKTTQIARSLGRFFANKGQKAKYEQESQGFLMQKH